MCKRIALFILWVGAFSASARDTTPKWLEVRSPHFSVMSDANEKQARHIAGQLERMRSVFHTVFPKTHVDADVPIVVLALKDKKGLRALEPEAYLAKGQIDIDGLFLRAPDKNYVLLRLDAAGEHPYAAVYHEYTHFLLRKDAEWLPLWFNEGLAEFFQNTEIYDKEVLLGEPSPEDILYLRQNSLLPLTTLLTVDQSSPYYHEEQKGSVFYAESWALVHYLSMEDKKTGGHRMLDYVQLVNQHVDSVTAAQRAFGDLKQLQGALESYVRQGSFQELKAPGMTNVDDAAFKVQELTLPQADAVRADFLAYNGRAKDAHALLDTVLQAEPENVLAHETMGYLEFRAGNIKAAQNWYLQAIRLDSQSYLAHYYFAVTSMAAENLDATQAPEVEASLRTAIKLNPSFAPSYDRLVVLLGMQHRNLDEAHLLSAQAIGLDPGNLGYRLNAANVLLEMHDTGNAIRVLQLALSVAKTPQEAAEVQKRLQDAERYQQLSESAGLAHSSNATTGSATVIAQQSSTRAGVQVQTYKIQSVTANEPKHPDEAHEPRHLISGVIQDVRCLYPSVLELKLQGVGKIVSLYSNNYRKVGFSALNFSPKADFDPCQGLTGLKARVTYLETSDKTTDGQIVAVELSK